MNRTHSQGSGIMSQQVQMAPHSRPGTADPMRSRSNTALSKGGRRPRSRGSTASMQSSTTQQTQDQQLGDGFSPFMAPQPGPRHNVFSPNPEEMIMRFGQQLAHTQNGGSLDSPMHDSQGSIMPRAEDFHNSSLQNHGLQHGSMSDMVPHGLQGMHVSHYPQMYDGAIDAHIPDRLLEENDQSETGPRKKRGSSSTVANDNELRKLLRQYESFTLKQMAVEVQKNDGAGGKSEKVKQVFAMVWLKENCRKSTGSVRRDRVYCCYAERCGSEHVSVLNPASFGKLVRIIFPNVQTRRLGVRGESKYHYVDLSVIEEKQQHPMGQASHDLSIVIGPTGFDGRGTEPALRPRSVSTSQPPADTAVFPSPTISFTPKFPVVAPNTGCACDSQPRVSFDNTITPQNVSSQTGRMIRQMLSFPSSVDSSFENESLRLPDIGSYLPANTDLKVADALAALYRTHCISVIDSFRFCKERNLFRHFSAFHGTLTVPVQKLLTHPNLAPWIKECDWLMYQKMIEFIAPLTTQVVPRPVLDAFGSISQRLTGHITETFKTHPLHVSMARLDPAHIFCNLLKHMLDVNQSANAAAAWLCHPDNRNQMWLDFASFVDPNELISKANIPACSEKPVERMLRNDIRALLTPLDSSTSPTLQAFYQQSDDDAKDSKSTVETSSGDEYSFPDKWIAFILNLPALFPNHPAQCIVDKVDKLWDAILHRLTLAGAQSFSAWWITKVFFHEMLLWQVEKGGFLKHTPNSLQQSLSTSESTTARRGSYSIPPQSESLMASENQSSDHPRPKTGASNASGPYHHPTEANGSSNSANLREKSVTLSESMGSHHATTHHDDSAIELCDDSILMSVGKYDMMASDPADAEGDVVVI